MFLATFHQGTISIIETFIKPEFFENGMAFVVILGIFIFSLYKQKVQLRFHSHNLGAFLLLTLSCLFYLLNQYIFRLEIAPAVLTLLAAYALLGFFIDIKTWKRSIFIALILVLTLPLLERLQRFLGFPIRLITARIVSFLLSFIGIGHVSDSTIIITENNATNIDLPCSGVKSIYTGMLFMFAVYYLQKVRLSWRLIGVTFAFFFLLLFFNTWRVFSLVYVYGVLELASAGDIIHVFLGIVGFIVSCVSLWKLSERYLQPIEKLEEKQQMSSLNVTKYLVGVLLTSAILNLFSYIFIAKHNPNVTKYNYSLQLAETKLTEMPFSKGEKTFFETGNVAFSKKYSGQMKSGKKFTLLLVSSTSARTHHDPEICLQGLGNTINDSNVVQLGSLPVRKLSLNEKKDTVLYWYVSKNKTILDYSERIWEEVNNPGEMWTLVELGFTEENKLTETEMINLTQEINTQMKKFQKNPQTK